MTTDRFNNRDIALEKGATRLSMWMRRIFVFVFLALAVIPISFHVGSPTVMPAFAQDNSLAIPRTIVDADTLRELNHLPEENYAYFFRVLDWSSDGKFILFGYRDYAGAHSDGMNSLAIIDAQTFNITKLELRAANEDSIQNIYLARISRSGDGVFILAGTSVPEDIFRYNLTDGTLARITNSSRIPWFDTVGLDDAELAYIDSKGIRFWPVDYPELGNKIDSLAGNYYAFLDHYPSMRQGKLDLNDDASKVAIAAGPLDSRGIIYADVSSGKTSLLQERTPCVDSVQFAPYDELLVYSEHPGQQCPFPLDAEEWSAPLRTTSLDGTTDELLYLDTWEVVDVVLSPDGKYAATFGFGAIEEDRSPKIMLLELPRTVPEFGSSLIIGILLSTLMGAIILSARFNLHRGLR